MIVTEITLDAQKVVPGDPLRFRVGQPVVAGGHVVEKIDYKSTRHMFNDGDEIGFGCYAVFFVGIPERRLIVERIVTTVEVVRATKTTEGTTISLPE